MFTLFSAIHLQFSLSMKSLRIIGSVLLGLTLAFSLFAPAEAQALVPIGVHDFFVSPDGLMTATFTGTFTGISRKVRGESNLGGISKLVLFCSEDFTADFPFKEMIVDGVLSTALPLKAGVVGAVLKFDNNTCRIKSDRKGDLGYQNVGVTGEAKFAGYSAEQITAIEKTFNQGGLAVAYYKNGGVRKLVGSTWEPLTFEDSTDSGAKADDKLQIDFKFKGDGYDFHPPVLGEDVVIPLPA